MLNRRKRSTRQHTCTMMPVPMASARHFFSSDGPGFTAGGGGGGGSGCFLAAAQYDDLLYAKDASPALPSAPAPAFRRAARLSANMAFPGT